MLDTPCSEVVWRVLATHCIRQFHLHFLSRASPCAITFQLDSSTCQIQVLRVFVGFTTKPLRPLQNRIQNFTVHFKLNRPMPDDQFILSSSWLLSPRLEIRTLAGYNENSSSGNRVVPCGQTDMTKLIVPFHNFANAFRNSVKIQNCTLQLLLAYKSSFPTAMFE